MIERVLILGTGLLGGSAGLALQGVGTPGAGLCGRGRGWDRDAAAMETALRLGAITAAADDPIEAARAADLVLLAGPVLAILDWMVKLAEVLGPDQLLTDVGSTKLQITAAAAQHFNQSKRAAFLPGHPMAGKEVSGAEHAEAAIFRGAVWIFTPAPGFAPAPKAAATAAEFRALLEGFGCRTLEMDAARHDELLAWVSHLPQFVSTALSALLEDEYGRDADLKAIGGRALREMTRLGSSPYSMWRDVALSNTEQVERALLALEQRIAHLRENLRTPELREEFLLANRFRR